MADVDPDHSAGVGVIGGVVLLDPVTRKPYRAQNIVQQTDGEFNTSGLASEAKQNEEIAALQALTSRMDSPTEVTVQNTEWSLPAGASTANKQDSIITALGQLSTLLGGDLSVTINGEPLDVVITSSTLPTGAASSANQADIKSALDDVLEALTGVLSVSGNVDVSSDAPLAVTGSVSLSNASLSVTPSGTFNVSVTGGSTSEKQDEVIAGIQSLLTRLNSPLAVTDNNASITVDGTVGISGTVPVSLSSVPTHAVTQSGTWTMQTTPGASATSSALTSFRSGTLSTSAQSIKGSSGRVYQYTFFNPNAGVVYVHLHDSAIAGVTPGTTVPKMSFAVPAGSTLDGYWSISHGFSTAISISASTNWDGSGAPASTMQVTVGYA